LAVGLAVGFGVGFGVGTITHELFPLAPAVHLLVGHLWHKWYAVLLWYLPFGQWRQEMEPVHGACLPLAQGWHELPVDGWYLPRGQWVQYVAWMFEYLPFGQVVHLPALYWLEYLPCVHWTHWFGVGARVGLGVGFAVGAAVVGLAVGLRVGLGVGLAVRAKKRAKNTGARTKNTRLKNCGVGAIVLRTKKGVGKGVAGVGGVVRLKNTRLKNLTNTRLKGVGAPVRAKNFGVLQKGWHILHPDPTQPNFGFMYTRLKNFAGALNTGLMNTGFLPLQ
jgi:hypothetical protein